MKKQIKILFKDNFIREYTTTNGEILAINKSENFDLVDMLLDDNKGSKDCIVHAKRQEKSFSFLPYSVNKTMPIYSSKLDIIITEQSDSRNYEQIEIAIKSLGLKTSTEKIEQEAQFSYAKSQLFEKHDCPTFLTSLGNVHIWESGFRGFPIEEKQHMDLYDYFIPRMNWDRVDFDEDATRVVYRYMLGRGMAYNSKFKRRNLNGYLPVLTATLNEDEIDYGVTAFCDSRENSIEEEKGSDHLVADFHSAAHVLSEEQINRVREQEEKEQDTILRVQFTAENKSLSSKIAYFRFPHINTPVMAESDKLSQKFKNGVGTYKNKVYMLVEGDKTPSSIESSFIIPPREKLCFNLILFFKPVTKEESKKYFAKAFNKKLKQTTDFWKERLRNILNWHLPEKVIDEAFKTGCVHLLESCYGRKDSSVLAPAVGVYSPIGSESSPVIRLFDSIGFFDTASKCLNYFYAKQQSNGFIQNMVGYMLENGAVLFTTYQHYVYSKDIKWLKEKESKILLAVDYLLKWIDNNKVEGKDGFGLIDGQVADPVDTFRSFALNSLAYAGLNGASNLLKALDNNKSEIVKIYAIELKQNIIKAYKKCMEKCPLVPLNNGEWTPSVAPWAEGKGATSLHLDGEACVTHASHILKDSLLSLPFLVYYGVFAYDSPEAKEINDYISDCFLDNKVAYSQPYYSLIPFIDLYSGNKNSFLRQYYLTFATMADRTTYSFWEHYFLATPHKTHEQGWFLMQTINMLYHTKEEALYLLYDIPDGWFASGKKIKLVEACCEFGRFSLSLEVNNNKCKILFKSDFKDKNIYIKIRDKVQKLSCEFESEFEL